MIIKMSSKITLAIIDDHDLWREKLKEMLTSIGFNVVIIAANGKEFIDVLEKSTTLPDVCLLDISMPVMNGYETATKLRELYPKIKILAFSMETDETVIARIMECGANGFIPKGVNLNEIRSAIIEMYQTGFHL